MLLCTAALPWNGCVKSYCGVIAAREHAVVAARSKNCVLWMVSALLEVGSAEPVAADLAVEEHGVSIDAPKDFSPRHAVFLRKSKQEFVEFERAISNVLGNHATMKVDKDVSVLAL